MSQQQKKRRKAEARIEAESTTSSQTAPKLQMSGVLGLSSPQIPQKSLAIICRSLGEMLYSGLDVQTAFRLAGDKISERRARQGMQSVREHIARRGEISTAMRSQGHRFPNLMVDLVDVGEKTGSLPEVFRSLAKHYETNVRMKRDLITSLAWPAFQGIAAIFIVALLIYVLGMLQTPGSEFNFDIFGLSGASGALTWLVMTFGTLAAGFIAYKLIMRNLAGKQFLDPLLMKIPVLGKCMRAFAIARFSWAFSLTQQAGMGIRPSLERSIRATDNGAFIMCHDGIWKRLRGGQTLTDSLAGANLFPEEFIQTVDVAETTGTVPETLDRLSPQFEEEAQRRMRALTAALGWGV